MMWTKFFCLLFILFLSSRTCLAQSNDIPVENEVKKKFVYKKPIVPEDAVLAFPFDSPNDSDKLIFSEATKEGVDQDIAKYDGEWTIEVPKTSAVDEDYALVLKSKGKHHAVAIDMKKDFTFDHEEFVVQYEVKFMDGLDCGGAYVKLLSASPDMKLGQFHDKTPYTIMFGPDKCGMDSKIRFIFRHKHPITGEFEEKHMKQPSKSLESFFTDKRTHLYTLVIRSDNSFEVYVDQSLLTSGNLLSEFEPPVNPPREVDDPNDKKPSEWDDRLQIPDLSATKPDDWDENAPRLIKDDAAVMPEGWLENEPKLVAKPDDEQPVDWDSDIDGDWKPSMIDNPICASAPGCGEWEKPMIENPAYKGKWYPPMLTNKDYKGEWKPKQIVNPKYFEDTEPYRMTPISALGLELWTMTAEIAFDNFYIGYSKKGADGFAEETWVMKKIAEKASDVSAKSVVDGIRDLASEKPWLLITVGAVSFILIALLLFYCCRSGGDHVDDAYHKKTDDVVQDIVGEEEEEEEENEQKYSTIEDEKKSTGESSGEEDRHSDDEKEIDDEKPKKSVRQRTRKE